MPETFPPTATGITSINSAAPDIVTTIAAIQAPTGFVAEAKAKLTGVTVTNTQVPGVFAQAFVGVLDPTETAVDADNTLVSPYLDGGEVFHWQGEITLNEGWQVATYADVTARLSITLETEQIIG